MKLVVSSRRSLRLELPKRGFLMLKKSRFLLIILYIFISIFCYADIIWQDGFETETGWTLSGEFEIDSPQGLGGDYGNPDPQTAYEGSQVLGVDLTGLGDYPGDYENNLADREYYAISPPIDCSLVIDVQLSFLKWLGIEQPAYDHAYIDISNDDGSSWLEIWTNDAVISDTNWSLWNFDISDFVDLHNFVRIRFSVGSTDGSWLYCGWNIDNIEVSGTMVDFGAIGGTVYDAQTQEPIENAQIMSQFGFTYTDENGVFLLNGVPEGFRSITIIALGYLNLTLNDIEVFADDTTYVNCEMEIDASIPPEPENLTAEIYYDNNVHLFWEPPEESEAIFLAYNIYRNDVVIQSVLEEEYYDLDIIPGIYSYYVTAVYDVGSSLPSNEVDVEITGSGIEDFQLTIDDFRLTNYPNPLNSSTTISFNLTTEHTESTEINIYNIKGQKVKRYSIDKGQFSIVWNGEDEFGKQVSSGIYFYNLRVDGEIKASRKCLLLR